jgi:hypothetical protein
MRAWTTSGWISQSCRMPDSHGGQGPVALFSRMHRTVSCCVASAVLCDNILWGWGPY